MAATPEILIPEDQIQERSEEITMPETIQKTGVQVVQKTFKTQVSDDKGVPLIQTPPSQVISVTLPAAQTTLANQAKGPASSSLTWLAAFWLRVVKKAFHFGWKIVGGQNG